MKHSEFSVGGEFTFGVGKLRCTDIGQRTIIAIRIDSIDMVSVIVNTRASRILTQEEAEEAGWFNGPPYAVVEIVLDENDQEACEPVVKE